MRKEVSQAAENIWLEREGALAIQDERYASRYRCVYAVPRAHQIQFRLNSQVSMLSITTDYHFK